MYGVRSSTSRMVTLWLWIGYGSVLSYEDRPESRLRLVDCRIRVSFNMEHSMCE